MNDSLRTTVGVAGWVLRLLLWNVAALVPIFANARPWMAGVWLVMVIAFLAEHYVMPKGDSLGLRLKRALATPLPQRLGWIFALGIAGTLLNLSFAELGSDFLGSTDNASETAMLAFSNRPGGALVLLGFVVLFAPCFEEFVFRGKILGLLRTPLGPRGAVVVSALLFGALHAGSPGGVLGRVCSGLVAGEAVLATGSLWSAVAVHAINNAIGSIGLLLTAASAVSTPPLAPSLAEALVLALVSTLAIEMILRRLRPVPTETS